jgi:hypothetical protein
MRRHRGTVVGHCQQDRPVRVVEIEAFVGESPVKALVE